MKILINDDINNHERLIKIFQSGGYERNELLFFSNYEEIRNFLLKNSEMQKIHIDAIVTNNHHGGGFNSLNAQGLVMLKNSLESSYSHGNFRINSIPVILYSDADEKSDLTNFSFDAIVKTKETAAHPYFIKQLERIIKKWRIELHNDFAKLELKFNSFPYFRNSQSRDQYYHRFGKNHDNTFHKTCVLSKEFIVNPVFLNYEWLKQDTSSKIEQTINRYHSTYTNHIKYNLYNNERTILHDFFKQNHTIILRDSYSDYLYEQPFKDVGRTKQICDFILTTNLPSHLLTTFFEVKKEDVKLMVAKKKKRPNLSAEFSSHVGQLWDYKKYSQNVKNQDELFEGIGYKTNRFSYQILAGRSEEKEELLEVFNAKMSDHYPGIDALTFEDLENLNIDRLNKVNRLKI